MKFLLIWMELHFYIAKIDVLMNKKVIVAGHICLDLTPAFSEYAVASADQFLKPLEELERKIDSGWEKVNYEHDRV